MRRSIWLWLTSVGLLGLIAILFAASYYLRIKPLPTASELQEAARLRHAERLRDVPSLDDLPPVEPIKIDLALILEPIDGLIPRKPEQAKPWRPPNIHARFPPEIDSRVEYAAQNFDPPTVIVEVQQFSNEAWPRYFAQWSPSPDILQHEDPRLNITRVKKFGNQVVVDRQYRSPDETGNLRFFWPNSRNLVSIDYRSRVIDEEFLRRYLERFPSSL